MDETRWSLISSHEITLASRGAEARRANFSGDPKQSVTVIAMINTTGEKMPLWLICKGTTARCENRFRSHFRRDINTGRLILCHQSSGRTDRTIARSVIDWLAEHTNGKPHCVLWDLFSAPRRGSEATCVRSKHHLGVYPGRCNGQAPTARETHLRKSEKPSPGEI
jgi:hypothetical protein